jgi:hypothetical protein
MVRRILFSISERFSKLAFVSTPVGGRHDAGVP